MEPGASPPAIARRRIAAAQLQQSPETDAGVPWLDAGPDAWLDALRRYPDHGFDALELSTAWLPIGELDRGGLRALAEALAEAGLVVEGVSVPRASVVDPVDGAANLAATHRAIEAAAALGVEAVCIGLHGRLTASEQRALWFWTGEPTPVAPESRPLAVARVRELAEHAGAVGLRLAVELYPHPFVATAAGAVRFVDDVGSAHCGLNPDLANLARVSAPVERWQDVLAATIGRAVYWHVKNVQRVEDPSRGIHLAWPTALDDGLIDYSAAFATAALAGFDGPVVVEHYGGDGLAISARSREYLRGVQRRLVRAAR